MKRLLLIVVCLLQCWQVLAQPAITRSFFSTNALTDAIEQTNTLVLSGFSYAQRTNNISAANGTYTLSGNKYVFNVTNVVSYVVSVGGWCLTNGMAGLNPALGNIVLAADFTQTATPTAESATWFDLFNRIPGTSLFLRTKKQTSDGPYGLKSSGVFSNATFAQGIILFGTDGTGKIMWSGTSDPTYAPGDFIAIINPVMDGGQRILYIGGPLASAQGELEAASIQVSRTNASAQTHGILAPRFTIAFLHPNGGQYSSWGFEMADFVANNATETGGGKQSLINLAPNGNAPTNMYIGAPEWTNFFRGMKLRVVTSNGLSVEGGNPGSTFAGDVTVSNLWSTNLIVGTNGVISGGTNDNGVDAIYVTNLTASRPVITDANKKLVSGGDTYTSYAAGTAYTLTATPAQLAFGTTSPGITISVAGTYMIRSGAGVKYSGATYAGAQTITLKLRRTNNTAADLTNGSRAVELPVLTTFTGGDYIATPEIQYTATAGDIVQLFGSVSATPSAGSVLTDSAEIIAIRLY